VLARSFLSFVRSKNLLLILNGSGQKMLSEEAISEFMNGHEFGFLKQQWLHSTKFNCVNGSVWFDGNILLLLVKSNSAETSEFY
jgi:hypothetical protein